MILEYNGTTYEAVGDSIYRDIKIDAETLDHACQLATTFDGMTEYTFNGENYSNMTVLKRIITIGNGVTFNIKLRKTSDKEKVEQELQSLRDAFTELSTTTNKTTTAKIKKILSKDKEVIE